VVCVTCGAGNDPGTKFCGQCGTRLAAACANCGSPLREGARFCGECGVAVAADAGSPAAQPAAAAAAAAAPAVAERRLVTVLFADLVGFTPFAEERDAEEVRETLSAYFEMSKEVIGRYGGTIEKFIGDAVMAVWGTPTAHEDDAERAVRAALELVQAVPALGPGIQARAGLLTGEAVVTLGATDQGMVAGDLVNTASRLQSAAPAGAVLVGEATHRAASKAVVFEPAGEQAVKGKTAPVAAWRALRVVAELGGRNRSETLEAPFVGRDGELRLLKSMLHGTARERRVRLVSITGIAGIGKSRLAWEIEKYLDGVVELVRWHAGRSPAYGEGLTFWALGEMVRSRAGLLETDDQDTTRSKVAATVSQWITDEGERRWIESALLALLGTGDPPPGGREALFGAWRTFFERIAATETVAMVFEDLHWADAGLLDFIDHMLEWSRDYPIFIITLARPELLERRPDWGAGKRNFTAIGLEPLAEPEMRELLAGLVPGLPDQTAAAIIKRAEGIPLYAVEMVRVLVTEGRLTEVDGVYRPLGDLGEIAVPETLQALIAARLDSLVAADRNLLQDAAVLGQSFSVAGLASVTGVPADELETRLRSLVRKDVLAHKVDPRSPERGQYSFVQALIREVAYNSLARPERKTRHLAAARWFESLGEEELAGALAAHYLAAYENAPAGPEADALRVQARLALKGAGDRAAGLGSHEQAIAFYDQALTVTAEHIERVELLTRTALAASLVRRHPEAEARARQALELELSVTEPDRHAVAGTTALLGRVLLNGFQSEHALEVLEPADREFADLRDDHAVIALGGQLARAYFFVEQNQRAIEVADRVLEGAEHANLLDIVADTLITKGSALCNLGRAYEGVGTLRTGQALAEANEFHNLVFRALANRVGFEITMDPRASFETARYGLALAQRLGWPANPVLVSNFAGAALRVGEWEESLKETAKLLEGRMEPVDWMQVAGAVLVVHALRGDVVAEERRDFYAATAQSDSEAARFSDYDVSSWLAFAEGRLADAYDRWIAFAGESALNAPDSLTMAGRAALWDSDADRARAALDQLDATGIHGPVLEVTRRALRAGILALENRRAEALMSYREVLRGYRDLGLLLDESLVGIDMLTVLGVSEPEVRAAAERAREILDGLRAKPFLARLDGLLHGASPKDQVPAAEGGVKQSVSARGA
jgi:class 3 adenylate cyclase/tetratricopeptide (TPR) repeat protein